MPSMKTAAKSASSRPALPVEPVWRSVAVLGIAVGVSVPVVALVDAIPGSLETGLRWDQWTRSLPVETAGYVLAAYVTMVLWHIAVRTDEAKQAAAVWSAGRVASLLVVWNYALMAMSLLLLVGCLQSALAIMRESPLQAMAHAGWGGTHARWVALVCDGDTMWAVSPPKPATLWQLAFMWSKFPELFDTVLLVVRGRTVILLHWYHHVTVLLYCWFVVRSDFPGIVFSVMNAFVHVVMYYYYARMGQGVRPAFGRMLTQIQLLQMVVGVVVAAHFIYLNRVLPPSECNGSERMAADGGAVAQYMITATVVMYGSYFFLFASFFANKHLFKAGRKPSGKAL